MLPMASKFVPQEVPTFKLGSSGGESTPPGSFLASRGSSEAWPRDDARFRGRAPRDNAIAPRAFQPEITREIYLHAIPEEQRRAVESVEKLVFGPQWTQVQESEEDDAPLTH